MTSPASVMLAANTLFLFFERPPFNCEHFFGAAKQNVLKPLSRTSLTSLYATALRFAAHLSRCAARALVAMAGLLEGVPDDAVWRVSGAWMPYDL